MQGLIIDTSCNCSYLILADSENPIAFLPMEGGEELSKSLGRRIKELLDQHPSFRANFIAIGTGPGSYTGIRVGAAMAKALAFGWQIPLFGFGSLQSFLPAQEGRFAVLTDAHMGGCYCLRGARSSIGVHPLRGDPALKGRVFQKRTIWEGCEAPPKSTITIPGLKAWVHFEEPFLLKSADLLANDEILVSPHPAAVQKRLSLQRTVLEAQPNAAFLAADCCRKANARGRMPLEELTLSYLLEGKP